MTPGPDDIPPTSHGGNTDPSERYQRISRIATGGMGEVWRARDTLLGREVAVKILKSEYADDPTFRARFEAEARHAAGLHHPGIASVFDYGLLPEENTPYLVMELVDGKPLSDLLANGQPFDPEVARELALQVAEALAVAHAAGVVHRDVKPANLLVTPDGRIKITDFGISLATNSVAFTQTGQIVGTPQYLSPEQARGNAATAASDVYALGVVLFECLAGRRPFTGDTPIATALAQIQQEIPPLPDSVPAGLAAVVNRALAKDPSQRYADGAAIATALRECANGGLPTAAMPAAVPDADSTRVLTSAAAPLAAGATLAGASAVDPDTHDQDAVDPEEEPHKRSRWPLYAAGLVVLALLAALLVTKPWAGDNAANDNGTDTSAPADPEADTVRVRRADYIGEPVDDAVAALEDLDLETRTRIRENSGSQEPDTVADLNPTGNVRTGTRITLEVWGAVPEEEAPVEPTEPDQGDTGQDDEGDTGNQGEGNQDNGNQGQGNQGNGQGNEGNGNQGNQGDGNSEQPETEPPSEESGEPGTGSTTNPGRSNQVKPTKPAKPAKPAGPAKPAEPTSSQRSQPTQGGTAADD